MPLPFRHTLYGRWLMRLSCALVVLYGLYVVGTWLALRRNWLLDRLTASWTNGHMQASRGYSLWPGIFHVEDAELRFMDYNVEIEVAAASARLDLGIWSLFRETIHLKSLDAEGARFRMIHRVTDGHRNRKRLAAFPDLGFERSRVYDAPSPPHRPPALRIVVENVDAKLEEVWILEYRALGKMHARGGFELSEEVQVFSSQVKLDAVDVFVEDRHFAREARCDIHAKLGPFDRKTADLEDVLSVTEGGVRCTSTLSDLSAINVYLPDSPWTLAGSGTWQADLNLVRGRLLDSEARFLGKASPLRVADHALNAAVQLSLEADPEGSTKLMGSWNESSSEGATRLKGALFEARLDQSRLWQGKLSSLKLEASGLSWDDPELLRKLRPHARDPLMKVHEGNLTFEYTPAARMNLKALGAFAIYPRQAEIVSCALSLGASCDNAAEAMTCSQLEVRCTPAAYFSASDTSAKLDAKVHTTDLVVAKESIDGTIHLETSNPKSLLDAFVARDVITSLGITLLPLGDLKATVRLRHREQRLLGSIPEFSTGAFRGSGRFAYIDSSFQSNWLVQTPLGRFSVDQSPHETKVSPFASANWLDQLKE